MAPEAASARWWWPLGLVAVLAATGIVVAIWLLPPRATSGSAPLTQPSTLPSIPLPTSGPSMAPPLPKPRILLAAGDVASCDSKADEAVARLASRLSGTIALLGDTAYESGSPSDYRNCFDPAWGPMRARIRPAVGNHEYETDGATGYFDYFGTAAGQPSEGWYSYDLGAWHVVVLNSNCSLVGCDGDSQQLTWLEQDLTSHASDCLLAYWHHARWSSGRHGSQAEVEPFWEVLSAHGADVVLNGHDHDYERIRKDGIREFVVGTGGRSHYPFGRPPLPETEVRNASTFGLLWLALGDGTYQWQFVGLGDTGFTDAGSGTC